MFIFKKRVVVSDRFSNIRSSL